MQIKISLLTIFLILLAMPLFFAANYGSGAYGSDDYNIGETPDTGTSEEEISSGGGGGIAITTENINGFEINENEFNIRIIIDETKTRDFIIKNKEDKEIEINIEIEDLKDFIAIPDTVTLKPKEEKTIQFDIYGIERQEILIGKIKLNYKTFVKEILVSINPQSKETLFDVFIDIFKKKLSNKEKLKSQLNIIPVGEKGVDAIVKYSIHDFNREAYFEESKTFYVDKEFREIKEFDLDKFDSGDYLLSVEINYLGGFASASSQFEVGEDLAKLYSLNPQWIIVITGILIIFLIILGLIFIKRKKHKNKSSK